MQVHNLDVLVVYSGGIALSASVADSFSNHPFLIRSPRGHYNLSYQYMLELCSRYDIRAGFTSSVDVIGPGKCKYYWTSDGKTWDKALSPAKANHVFMKLSPRSPKRKQERSLLLSSKNVQTFNNQLLAETFFDKLLTYERLPEYAIPTVAILSSTSKDIASACDKLKRLIQQHPFAVDFGDSFVLKDRYGAGGNYVYLIEGNSQQQIKHYCQDNPNISFVLQPFLPFDNGFSFRSKTAPTDIRLIYHHNRLFQSYIRMAQDNDFRCNEHQGGKLIYVTRGDIPRRVLEIGRKIVTKIDKPRSLFALDFVVSNTGHVYFIEGNIGPGIDWDQKNRVNEVMSKQLIHQIVLEFADRLHKPIHLVT